MVALSLTEGELACLAIWNEVLCGIKLYKLKWSFYMLLKGYLNVEEVAKQLGLSEYRVRELIREKQIRATKIRQWRVKPEDLEDFMKSRTNKY